MLAVVIFLFDDLREKKSMPWLNSQACFKNFCGTPSENCYSDVSGWHYWNRHCYYKTERNKDVHGDTCGIETKITLRLETIDLVCLQWKASWPWGCKEHHYIGKAIKCLHEW